jgi:glycosyltransferase involved in cell wall biosynthesis
MVETMLHALGGDARERTTFAGTSSPTRPIECYHVDARVSRDLDDVGSARGGKLFLLLRHCLHAIWLRVRYGVSAIYYIPASSGRAAIYRDWIVMACCRPFFRQRIYHWHAVGWADWVSSARGWERWMSRTMMRRPAMSLVLGNYGRRDAEACQSQRVEVVPNGLPDPCPEFAPEVLKQRASRLTARRTAAQTKPGTSPASAPEVFRLLYLGLCYRPKGLFDAVEGVLGLNRALRGSGLKAELTVAGSFWKPEERAEFDQIVNRPEVRDEGLVKYAGFVQGKEKHALLKESDCLCIPTYYEMEGFPLVIVEALAYGLPILTTRWRMLPDVLPHGYPGLVHPHQKEELVDGLRTMMEWSDFAALRSHYLQNFTQAHFEQRLAAAILAAAG